MNTYYEPRDLYVADTPLWLRINCEDVVGFARFTDAGKPRWKIGAPRDHVDLPKGTKVEAWRPVDPQSFPDELPEPKKLLTPPSWESPPEPPSAYTADENDDWWVKPSIHLGRPGEPPESQDECMIRIFRAIATRRDDARKNIIEFRWLKGQTEMSLPQHRVAAAQLHEYLRECPSGRLAGLRPSDYDDFWLGTEEQSREPHLEWKSTHRDMSEFEDGRVFSWIPHSAKRLFALRSGRPALSFAMIAVQKHWTEDRVRNEYRYQCKEAFKRARR